jgi:hypothetical protein
MRIVCLHECGGVMVMDITHDAITAYNWILAQRTERGADA